MKAHSLSGKDNMLYSVTGFKNTGFNSINIPDKPSLLDSMERVEFGDINIVQNRGLIKVSLYASWDKVKELDYVRISGSADTMYYTVRDIQMSSKDVAELLLLPDYLTSAGGPANLQYTGGITTRRTVINDDGYAYASNDEYLAPAFPLKLKNLGKIGYSGNSNSILVTSVDLNAISGNIAPNGHYLGATLDFRTKDEDTNIHDRLLKQIPEIPAANKHTLAKLGNRYVPIPGVELYSINGTTQYVMSVARSLALDNAFLAAYNLPEEAATLDLGDSYNIKKINSRVLLVNCTLAKYQAKNDAINWGPYNKVLLISVKGDRVEMNPEDCMLYEGSNNPVKTTVQIKSIVDPRYDGFPIFYFSHVNGIANDIDLLNSVAGLPWANVPLLFTGSSGSALARYDLESNIQRMDVAQQQTRFNQDMGTLSSMMSIGMAGVNGDFSGVASGTANFITQMGNTIYTQELYEMDRNKELAEFGLKQNIVAPDLKFPYQNNLKRDAYGNSAHCYQFTYDPRDVARIDRLLTMYGYKDCRLISKSMFNCRSVFDYVRASGVSVSGTVSGKKLPMYVRDGIAAQLNAGVRVWHQKPKEIGYDFTNTPIPTNANFENS